MSAITHRLQIATQLAQGLLASGHFTSITDLGPWPTATEGPDGIFFCVTEAALRLADELIAKEAAK